MSKSELERVDSMSIMDIVAYVNRLCMQLEHSHCTAEDKKNALESLHRLADRVRFLKLRLEPGTSRFMCSH